MRAGRLRHRVTLQTRGDGSDAAGQPVDTWVELAPAWARVEPISGRDLFRAREAGMEATHQVTLRYRSDMRDGQEWRVGRIVHDGRHLYPEGPPMDVMERGEEVTVMVTERTDPEGA